MGAPYAIELRERALAAIDKGMSKWQAHKTFNISRTTLDHWLKRRKNTGNLKANTQYTRGPKPAIPDNETTRAFFNKHQHKTLAQLCELWLKETGVSVSDVTMSKTLKRLGYTRKKRATSTANVMNKNDKLS